MSTPNPPPLIGFSPSQTGEEFLARLKKNGWEPEEAMMAYQEWRTFGFSEVRREPEPGSDENALWTMRQRLTKALEKMKGPKDWGSYLEKWSSIAYGHEPTHDELVGTAGAFYLVGSLSRPETLLRLSGKFASRGLPAWEAIREVGMDWKDVEESVAKDKVSVPDSAASSNALAKLIKSVEDSGLRSFQWPAANGSSAATLTGFADQITRANTELSEQTGWKGGVLGLNGRLSIGLGMSQDGSSGYFSRGTLPTIVSRADYGWGPVAHEWLHGLDNVMSHGEYDMASAGVGKFSKKWGDLVEGLNNPIMTAADREELSRQTVEGLLSRHTKSPELVAWLKKTLDTMGEPGWDRKKALTTVIPWVREDKDDATHAQLRAELVLTEMDLVVSTRKRSSGKTSPWVQFADRFDENLKTHHKKMNGVNHWIGYLKNRAEQVAHSFESLFPAGSLTSDVGGGARNMRYPLPRETEIQRAHWKKLFSQTSSWWEKDTAARRPDLIRGVSIEPLVDFAATRLQSRRRRKAETVDAMPMAARARTP